MGHMLWEVMQDVRLYKGEAVTGHNNPAVWLDVVTPAIRERYGSEYQGELIGFGGVHGRLSDIPAYLGGEQVISARWNGTVLEITI